MNPSLLLCLLLLLYVSREFIYVLEFLYIYFIENSCIFSRELAYAFYRDLYILLFRKFTTYIMDFFAQILKTRQLPALQIFFTFGALGLFFAAALKILIFSAALNIFD